jgi:hypothetical protein
MTIQNKQAVIESARMAIAYEFKSRHSFKGGRYSPRENVRDAVIFVRRMGYRPCPCPCLTKPNQTK